MEQGHTEFSSFSSHQEFADSLCKALNVLDLANSKSVETWPPWRPNAEKSVDIPSQHAASFL